MIIFCDGSAHHQTLKPILAWGIRVEHGEDDIEITGFRRVGVEQRSCHEIVAVIESIIYSYTHGGTPETTTIYTDDRTIVDGINYHHTQEWGDEFVISPALEAFVAKVSYMYSDHILGVVYEYFEKARIVWMKSHAYSVNNMRVDYLAYQTLRAARNKSPANLLPFYEWIAPGFGRDNTHWHPPFTSDIKAELATVSKLRRQLRDRIARVKNAIYKLPNLQVQFANQYLEQYLPEDALYETT